MKKEIEFDFAKWGQEGITASTEMGDNVLNIIKLKYPRNGYTYIVEIECKTPFLIKEDNSNLMYGKITMFEEVKPREFWVNISKKGNVYIYKDGIEAGASTGAWDTETIKVREVLD